MLFLLQLFTRNIKKIKSGIIDLRYKGMLKKHLNIWIPVFSEHSNIDERGK